jgi:hypothetical protein
MLEHLTELVDIIERAFRKDGMNQASCREIEPAHQVSIRHLQHHEKYSERRTLPQHPSKCQ